MTHVGEGEVAAQLGEPGKTARSFPRDSRESLSGTFQLASRAHTHAVRFPYTHVFCLGRLRRPQKIGSMFARASTLPSKSVPIFIPSHKPLAGLRRRVVVRRGTEEEVSRRCTCPKWVVGCVFSWWVPSCRTTVYLSWRTNAGCQFRRSGLYYEKPLYFKKGHGVRDGPLCLPDSCPCMRSRARAVHLNDTIRRNRPSQAWCPVGSLRPTCPVSPGRFVLLGDRMS